MRDFETRCEQQRRRLGVSQEWLAARAGLSYTTVWRLENGISTPRRVTAAKLCKALQLAPGEWRSLSERVYD